MTNRANLSVSALQGLRTFYIAESGYEIILRQLFLYFTSKGTQGLTCSTINGAPIVTNSPLFNGQFTITTVGNAPNAANSSLASAVIATDNILALVSASGFAPYGQAVINDEAIYYDSIVDNTLIGVQRGRNGTVATAHAASTNITQNQCTINIKASIPTMAAPIYTRQLTTIIPMVGIGGSNDGWAVGDQTGNRVAFARWNSPTPGVFNYIPLASGNLNLFAVYATRSDDMWAAGGSITYGNPSANRLSLGYWNGTEWLLPTNPPNPASSATIYGIHCISTALCWAVGGGAGTPTIARWNDISWSIVPSGINTSQVLRSVSCGDASNCMAVGDSNGTNPIITRWTAVSGTWTPMSPQVPVNTSLNSVSCTSPSNCWAVGNIAGADGALILRWTGSNWIRVTPTPIIPSSLKGVHCNGNVDCWAVGDKLSNNGALLVHYTSATNNWVVNNNNLSLNRNLTSVGCLDSNNCWAVGDSRTFLKYTNGVWEIIPAPTDFPNTNINAVSLFKAGNAATTTYPSIGGMWGNSS